MHTTEFDTLAKSLKDATDAIKTAHSDMEKSVEEKVEQKLKLMLRNHPGFTPARTIKFGNEGVTEADAILGELPKEVHYEMDKIYLLSSFFKVHPKQLKSYSGFRRIFEAKAGDFMKALDSTTAGGVDEWVPTEMSPTLKEKVRLQLKVAGLFPVVPMPSNPFQAPVELGNYNTFYLPEQTADTGQTAIPVGDGNTISGAATFSAKLSTTRVLMSKVATEDSMVPLMPQVQQGIALGLAQAREDFILNGDTAGSHEDTDITSATDRRKGWLGLRALANDNAYTTDLSTLSLDNLLTQRGAMGVYGVNPADLAHITGIKGYIAMMKIDGVQTLDKMGPNAVLLAGQLGAVGGVPIIVSEWVREVLNSTGIYESGQTRTVIYTVNRQAFGVGERSRPQAELLTELYAIYGQNAMLITERVDFQPFYTIASNHAIDLGVNVG